MRTVDAFVLGNEILLDRLSGKVEGDWVIKCTNQECLIGPMSQGHSLISAITYWVSGCVSINPNSWEIARCRPLDTKTSDDDEIPF